MNGLAVASTEGGARELSPRQLNEAGRRTSLALFFAEHFLGQERFQRLLGSARARNRRRMLDYFADWPRNTRMPVREIRFTTHRDFWRTHVPDWEPAVFRGFAKDWPAVREWTLEFFAQHYADTSAISIDQYGLFGEGETGRYETSTLGSVIAAIRAGQRRCLRFSPIIDENPQLKDYLDMAWFAGFRTRFSIRTFLQLFIAPSGTYTPIHCALESNAFVQVYGKKRWLLHPAMYQPLLEPPAARRPYFHTDYLPERGSPEFPLGDYAPAYEVVLEPGDVMYVPPFVWHYVENLSDTIAVAYRFFSLRAGLSSSVPLTVAKFLATRPSLLHTLVCPRRALNRRCRVPDCPFALAGATADLG